MDGYLDALVKELRALGEMTEGRRPDTVYIGGGTPTTLEPEQLDRLLGTITECFDVSRVLEFTVEAGRPDSITEEKLRVIRKYPVTRISVNPQTMQQKTLDLVGRRHTVEDVENAFRMARRLGFDNINMDLIAGLPGETAEDMKDTLAKVEALHPDSLTVHALVWAGGKDGTAPFRDLSDGGRCFGECGKDGDGALLSLPAEEYCGKFRECGLCRG